MCDICQEVCPFNTDREEERGNREQKSAAAEQVPLAGRERLGEGANLPRAEPLSINGSIPAPNTHHLTPDVRGASPTSDPAFQPRSINTTTKLTDLLYLTQEEFSEKFKGSAVKRAKRRGLLRNAAVALVGRDDPEAIAALEHALNDPEELVRDAAERALLHVNEMKM